MSCFSYSSCNSMSRLCAHWIHSCEVSLVAASRRCLYLTWMRHALPRLTGFCILINSQYLVPKTGAIHLEIHTTISKWRPKAKYKAVFNANFGYFDYPKLTYLTIKTGKYRYNIPLKILILLNIYLGRYIQYQTK